MLSEPSRDGSADWEVVMEQADESELVQAGQTGQLLDGTGSRAQTIHADLLRKGCLELKEQMDPRGIRLKGLTVVGRLDLAGLAVPFPLHFNECEFEEELFLEGAELFGLSLTGCQQVPGFLGNGLRLRRDLDLSGCQVVGAHATDASAVTRSAVWLREAEIGGRLLCIDTVIDGQGHFAIQAEHLHTGGSVLLTRQFTAHGGVRFAGARINGAFDCTGANIDSLDGAALDLGESEIRSSVLLVSDHSGRQPEIRGRVDMNSANIFGSVIFRDATLIVGEQAGADDKTRPGTAINAPGLSVGAEVAFGEGCDVTGAVNMAMTDVRTVSIGPRCILRAAGGAALNLTNAQIRALLRLDKDASVEGHMRLAGAVIRGTLALHGTISKPEHWSLVGGRRLRVDGDVFLDGLRTDGGRVNFARATLGNLSGSGARLSNPTGYSIDLTQTVVNGSVNLSEDFVSIGLVTLNRSSIAGKLQLTGGSFTCPGKTPMNRSGNAIEAVSATARGGFDLGWRKVSPGIDFTNANTTFLADDPAAWPERFAIAGFTYDRFENSEGAQQNRTTWDPAARCAWLGRQAEFDAGSYEQAARVFQRHGYDDGAEQVLIAQRGHARRVNRADETWLARGLSAIYAMVGYGYRPSRVLWLLAVLLILVTVSLELPVGKATLRANDGNGDVYSTSGLLASTAVPATARSSRHADSCGDGDVRCFSSVLYAIDTVIPLISLEQRSTWYPDPNVRGGELMLWWLNLATLLGWFLSSIFALSLTRLARSQ